MLITPVVHLPTNAPGPSVELLVSGIDANLVPDPTVADAAVWTSIIAGTYPGILPPTGTAGQWSRSTAAFASTPASIRCVTTGTNSSGFLYITEKIPIAPNSKVSLKAKVRVTVTDIGARKPIMKVITYNAAGAEFVEVGADLLELTWSNTVSGTFVQGNGLYTVPDNTVAFRIGLSLKGVASGPTTTYFDDFEVKVNAGANRITVSRLLDGQSDNVQGGVDTPILGETMVFTDYAIPPNVPLIYQVVTTLNGVVKASILSSAVVVGFQGMWMSDPLVPSVAIKVNPGIATSRSKSYTKDSTLLSGVGRREPLSINGVRRVASNIPVTLYTYTALQTFSLETLLMNTDPIMVRCSSEYNLPGLCYISAKEILAEFVDAPQGETCRWTFSADLVSSKGLDVMVPIRTYDDLLAEASDYQGIINSRATYLEVLRGG